MEQSIKESPPWRALTAAAAGLGWVALDSPLFQADALTAIMGLVLLGVCVGPGLAWWLRRMPGLPLFEVYCLAHVPYYWFPATRAHSVLWEVPDSFRARLFTVVALFLGCGALVYYNATRWRQRRGPTRASFWSRPVDGGGNGLLFWAGLAIWAGFQAGLQGGRLPDLGQAFPYIRSVCNVAGILGILYLAGRLGARTLPAGQALVALGLLAAGTLSSIASGFLVGGAVILCSALFAFTMGRRAIPWLAAALVFALLDFLNLGKSELRQKYWEYERQGTPAGTPLPELYADWIQASLRRIKEGPPPNEPDAAPSLVSRTDLTRMLGIVVSQTPNPLPYLNGESYAQSLGLFVPRILWPARPDVHYPMQRMGLYYGVHTEESIEHTSISFGQIAEAWANFGWVGVVTVGALMGGFFALGAAVSSGQPLNSVGYFFGTMFIGWTLNVEHSFGPFLMQFYQSALVSLLGLGLLARRGEGLDPHAPPDAA